MARSFDNNCAIILSDNSFGLKKNCRGENFVAKVLSIYSDTLIDADASRVQRDRRLDTRHACHHGYYVPFEYVILRPTRRPRYVPVTDYYREGNFGCGATLKIRKITIHCTILIDIVSYVYCTRFTIVYFAVP